MEDMPTSAEISTLNPARIVVKAPFVMKDHIKAIPGAKWSTSTKEWTIPLSWPACLALQDEFPGLEIGPALMAWASKMGPNKRWLRASRMNVDLNPEDTAVNQLIASDEFKGLYPHQKMDALCYYMSGGSYLIMNEVGVGKTLASLSGLRLLDIAATEHGATDPFPALITAPKSMVRTWEREIRKAFPDAWGEDQRSISIVDGTPSVVRKALEPGADFYIIGWELLRRYGRIASYGSTAIPSGGNVDKELNFLGLSTIIGDEIHRISDPTSQRSRAFKYLAHRVNYRIGLTGTPMQEGAEDLWHILHCIRPDEYPTKTAYIERYLNESWGEWGERILEGLRADREEEFRKNFEAVTRRMTTAILPNLPKVKETVRWVDLPPKHRKAYNSMRDTLIAEIDGGTLTAQNQLVKASRLIQLANSYGELTVEEDGTEKFVMTDKSPKLDALMEDIENGDFDGHSVVIFSESKQLLSFLAQRLEKDKHTYTEITGDVTGEDRQKAMDEFQAGEKQFCLLTRAGGEGITLTAADIMVRLVRPWSYRIDVQAAARVRRIGSEKFEYINYIDYLVQDTMDEQVVIRLNAKGEAAEEVLRDGELRAMLEGNAADDER